MADAVLKGGVHLENLGTVRVLALDKTGTLTVGRPEVTDVVPIDSATAHELLRIAAAVERQSQHPLAQAVVRKADAEHVPVVVDEELAPRLAAEPGSPVLFIDTVVWTLDGRAVDWATIWLLPEHFRFVVTRRRLYEDLAG